MDGSVNYEDKRLTLDDVRPYLVNAKEVNGQIRCSCPLCEGQERKGHHLFIKSVRDALVLYCQKCNAPGEDIINEFRRQGAKHISTEIALPKTLVEDIRHEYHNPDGTVAYYKYRKKWSDGSKKFTFSYIDQQGKEVYRKPENCNVIYNLHLMQNAIDSGNVDRLFIVEGEKKADLMVKAGFLAISSNTGAKSKIPFSETDLKLLSAFPIKIVIPDLDSKGQDYVQAWDGATVFDLKSIWKDAPPKADIGDYLELGKPIEPLLTFKVFKLDMESVASLSATEILSDDFFNSIFAIKDELERKRALAVAGQRASELKLKRSFDNMFKAYLMKVAKTKVNHGNVIGFEDKDRPPIKGLVCGDWIVDVTGIYKPVQTDEGEYQLERVSSMPIVPTAILRNIENGSEKISLAFYRDDEWKTINVQRSLVSNNAKIIDLSDLGVDVNSGTAKDLVKYLSVIINSNDSSKLPRLNTVGHLGWVEENFIPYCETIKTDIAPEFVDTVNAFETPKGNLDDWLNVVGKLRSNIYLRMTLNASLASPVLSMVNALPFVFHLWANSGSGKTVGLMVAASVWGNPAIGKCVKSLNNTQNYILAQLSFLKNLPFFGDELQTIKSVDGYDKLIMKICEGVDRGRLDRNSLTQKLNSWCNVSITTGEEPCTHDNSGSGTVNRVIECECVTKVVENGHEVSNFVKNNYGLFGRVWIEEIKKHDMFSEYRDMYDYLLQCDFMTEKQAMAMALLMVVDGFVNEMFPDKQETLTIDDIAPFVKTKEEVDVTERAWEYLLSAISEHSNNFITSGNTYYGNVVWGKYHNERPNILFFNNKVLDKLLAEGGFSLKACKEKWIAKKRIALYGGKFTCPQRLAENKVRCVALVIER